jgi:hypothetical protein
MSDFKRFFFNLMNSNSRVGVHSYGFLNRQELRVQFALFIAILKAGHNPTTF